GGLGDAVLQDGELVAAHARDGVDVSDDAAQAGRHQLEELVAGGVAEGVVDRLEAVEVENVDGERRAVADTHQRMPQPFVEEHAVRHAGQGIVQRHVGDLGFGAPLLGDVLVGGHGAAVTHRLNRYGDAPAVAQVAQELVGGRPAAPV